MNEEDHLHRHSACRPRALLADYGRRYPRAWKQADAFRSGCGTKYPAWPDWCFLPITATLQIVAEELNVDSRLLALAGPDRAADAGHLAALAAWRVTQGVYRFDKQIFDSLCETPVLGVIPHDVLYRLPEWCVYIETPFDGFAEFIHGVFAHLESDINTGRPELRLVLDTDGGLQNLPLHLGSWPLDESISRMLQACEHGAAWFGRGDELAAMADAVPGGLVSGLRSFAEPLVSLLLYLCCQNAEIGDGVRLPSKPSTKKVKSGERLFASESATIWEVGVRLGAALREAKREAVNIESTTGHHARPRAHIRRAHWHGYWSGPKLSAQRAFSLKWQPPTPVNVDDVDALPATVRAVA